MTAAAPPVEPSDDGVPGVHVAESGRATFHTLIAVGRHRFVADEPISFGGTDEGPSPYDLVAAALGACTTMTLRMYADRSGIPLERAEVVVHHDKIHAADSAHAGDTGDAGDAGDAASARRSGRRIDRFRRQITLTGPLAPAQRRRLVEIADRCPVHRTLTASSVIDTVLVDGDRDDTGGAGR